MKNEEALVHRLTPCPTKNLTTSMRDSWRLKADDGLLQEIMASISIFSSVLSKSWSPSHDKRRVLLQKKPYHFVCGWCIALERVLDRDSSVCILLPERLFKLDHHCLDSSVRHSWTWCGRYGKSRCTVLRSLLFDSP